MILPFQRLFLPLALAASMVVVPCAAQPPSADPPILEPSELRPGMKGYGLTVFRGTEPERFGAEVLGVVRNNWVEGDLILMQLDHPALEGTGVIQGMSGSPVFIDEKLVGAVALGWSFTVRPVCGVTPIGEMLKIRDRITAEPSLPPEEWGSPLPDLTADAQGLTAGPPEATARFQPLGMPLFLSTSDARFEAEARRLFPSGSFVPVAAGAMGAPGSPPPADDAKLQPGSAIGIDFIRGDFQMAGIGTVTWVDDRRLIAFGHAMTAIGAIDAPVSLAAVVTSIPTLAFPFKMGYTVQEIGALREDRQFGIGATLEARTEMLPVVFRVTNSATGSDRTFRYEVMPERRIAPGLVGLCVAQSVAASSTLDGPMNLEIDYRITLADGRTLHQSHRVTGESGVLFAGSRRLIADLTKLQSNRFEPVRLRSVQGTIVMDERHRVMTLDRVIREKSKVRRGEALTGTARLVRWRDEPLEVDFRLALPKELRAGSYELYLADGRNRAEFEKTLRPELSRVERLNDLVEQMEEDFPEDTLYVLLVDPAERLVMQRQRLDDLPASVRMVTEQTTRDPKQALVTKGRLVAEQRLRFEDYVSGVTMLPIDVKEK